MKLEAMQIHRFAAGPANPAMELLNNGQELWLTYVFEELPRGYQLNQHAVEFMLDEMVADSRYPATDYEVLDYTILDDDPSFEVDILVNITLEGKTTDAIYKELWPITHEMNRLGIRDCALKSE